MNIDLAFSRNLLSCGHRTVKDHFPAINLTNDAWIWHDGRDHYEFHGPDEFYWHGTAANAYDARYHGWMAWLRHKGIEL